jgi:hypothetical protein
VSRETCISVVELPLAVVLSRLSLGAQADRPGSKVRVAAPMQGIAAEVGDDGSTWYPPPGQLWNGEWVPPHWGANHHYGVWAPHGGPAVPTHWVWGPSGGAFDIPLQTGEARPGVG